MLKAGLRVSSAQTSVTKPPPGQLAALTSSRRGQHNAPPVRLAGRVGGGLQAGTTSTVFSTSARIALAVFRTRSAVAATAALLPSDQPAMYGSE